ncbi:MAG: hypothetical protein ACRD1T_20030 [Acidimicrobiia bacterium]
MTWQPDDFEDLAGELRRRVGHEFREEAEEVERLADLQRRRRASLAEVALDALHRGDEVTIRSTAKTWTGKLIEVGDDYVRLQTSNVVVEALLEGVAFVVVTSRSGGRSGRPASSTWKARLSELALSGEPVTVLAPALGLEVAGVIELVARDHVVIGGPGRSYVPLWSLVIVLRSVPR